MLTHVVRLILLAALLTGCGTQFGQAMWKAAAAPAPAAHTVTIADKGRVTQFRCYTTAGTPTSGPTTVCYQTVR